MTATAVELKPIDTSEDMHGPPGNINCIYYLGRLIGYRLETPGAAFEGEVEAHVAAYTGYPQVQASILADAALERALLYV